jgi:hypothetical protein
MTAALGFRCADGVVLAADSEITGSSSKWSERKIIGFPRLKTHPYFAYSANDVGFAKNIIDRLAAQIKHAEESKSDIVVALRADLKKIHKEYSRLFPQKDDRPSAEMLLTIRNPHQVLLYVIRGVELNRVTDADYIGIGEPIVRTAASPFFQGTFTINAAAQLAVYALMHAKEFGQFVGQRSDVLHMRDNSITGDYWYDENRVKQLEEDFKVFQEALRPLLIAHHFWWLDNESDKTFTLSLKAFVEGITRQRNKRIKESRRIWKELERDMKRDSKEQEEKSQTDLS